MSQSGYRRLTNAKFTSYFPLWMVHTRQVLLRLNHVLDIVFIFVHAVLGLPLPDCFEVDPVYSIFLTSLLTFCLDHFFPGNSFTILAPRQPFSLKHASITALSLSLNTIFSHEQKDLVCQNEIPLYLKQIASLMSYWNVTLWHFDILTC